MFRVVELPADVPGVLLLHSMPGRRENLAEVWRQIGVANVSAIVSLAGLDEARQKSPEYAEAIASKTLPCELVHFPVIDYGVPEDRHAFWALACDLAERTRQGQRLLVHCGAGIGRTGTLAICILLALGTPLKSAKSKISNAGSGPETAEQRGLVEWCGEQAGLM